MITVRLKGGQGNQMFQYAFARALAIRNKDQFQMDLTFLLDRTPRHNFIFRDYDIAVFKIEERFTFLSQCAKKIPLWIIWPALAATHLFFKRVFGIQRVVEETSFLGMKKNSSNGDIYLNGYWQNENYFLSVAETIRKDFTLRAPLKPQSQALAEEIAREESICVNVRRTDFVSLDRSIKMHGFVGLEYYQQGMAEIKKRVSNGRIYVFSDDIDWCRENLKFGAMPTTYVGYECKGNKFEEYLYLMSLCKHFLIPNSTFGWWGAWLSRNPGKIIIAPKKWFRGGRDDLGIVPSSWIRI